MAWRGITSDDTDHIISLMAKHPAVIVSCPTGTGKSTVLVQAFEKESAVIFVTEPTIPAVNNLYDQMLPKFGSKLGKASDSEIHYTSESTVVYCTAGHLKRKLMSYFVDGKLRDWDFCTVLMLDEAHLGTLDNDFIMFLWNYARKKGVVVPRLVLPSATIDIDTIPFEAAFYKVDIPTLHKIDVQYHGSDFEPDDRKLYDETALIINKFHMEQPMKPTDPPSIWLAYAAGSREVDTIAKKVLELAADNSIEVLTEHSKLDPIERQKIFEPVPAGQRRLIVATNSAETSITINNLSGIFDTLTEKFSTTSASGGFRLTLGNISRASADQRTGRTGRTCDGFCYRMCTPGKFERLEPKRQKEIFRIPIHNTIIETLNMGLDPRIIFAGQIDTSRLTESVKILNQLGMLVPDSKGIGGMKVTAAGTMATHVPLSVYSTACLYEWQAKKLPMFVGIVMMTMIDKYDSIYYYPKKKRGESDADYATSRDVHYEKFFKMYEARTDLEVLINIWSGLMEKFNGYWVEKKILRRFCGENFLNAKKIREIFKGVTQIVDFFELSDDDIGRFKGSDTLKFLGPILKKVFHTKILVGTGSRKYFHPVTREEYSLDQKLNLRPPGDNPAKILPLCTAEIDSGRGKPFRIITLSMPV